MLALISSIFLLLVIILIWFIIMFTEKSLNQFNSLSPQFTFTFLQRRRCASMFHRNVCLNQIDTSGIEPAPLRENNALINSQYLLAAWICTIHDSATHRMPRPSKTYTFLKVWLHTLPASLSREFVYLFRHATNNHIACTSACLKTVQQSTLYESGIASLIL